METTTDTESQPSPAFSTHTPQSGSKRTRSRADQVLEKIAKRIDQQSEKPAKEKYCSFGEHVAEKLRHMQPNMVPICQKIISDAIFLGETLSLSNNSRIVTEHVVPQNSTFQTFNENSETTSSSQYTIPQNASSNRIMAAYLEALNDVND